MPRKYSLAKLMRGRGQQNAKKLSKPNKKSLNEHNLMLHIEKLLKLSRNKKAFHQRALKSLNNIKDSTVTYEMALQFDNLYVEDAKSVSAKDLKIQGLKELNLIHLDLLQQQADQINESDKRIRILEEENKNLKSRLDRIDRRVSLTLHKKLSSIEPLTVDTYLAEEESELAACEKQTLSYISPIRNCINKTTPKLIILPDKKEDSPDSQNLLEKKGESINLLSLNSVQTLRTSPREKKPKKDAPLVNIICETLNVDCNKFINTKAVFTETKGGSNKKTKLSTPVELLPAPVKKDITDHSLRSRDKLKDFCLDESELGSDLEPKNVSEDIEISIDDDSTPLQTETDLSTPEEKYENKANEFPSSLESSILTTDLPYFLATHHHPFTNSLSCEESSLEIPKWRVRNLSPLYIMEGTENLGEEIFLKRHGKPEHDERRRKRWDLQRMREQRQYEKLRERYDSRHKSPGVRPGCRLSLWPNCDALLSVCVEPQLPVCAFGQPLTVMNQESFCVSWLSKTTQMTPKKKHR